MSEPREFDFIPSKRAARYLAGKPNAALRFRRQKITALVDSDFAGDPVSRKSTTGLVAQIGNHTAKSGSTLQSLTALSVGEAEFYAVVKGGQVGLSLRSMYQFDGEFFDGSIGSRTAKEAHWHAVLLDTRTSPRWRPQCQEGGCSEELRWCWNKTSLCFNATTTLQVCRIGILLTMDPTLHHKADEPVTDLVKYFFLFSLFFPCCFLFILFFVHFPLFSFFFFLTFLTFLTFFSFFFPFFTFFLLPFSSSSFSSSLRFSFFPFRFFFLFSYCFRFLFKMFFLMLFFFFIFHVFLLFLLFLFLLFFQFFSFSVCFSLFFFFSCFFSWCTGVWEYEQT